MNSKEKTPISRRLIIVALKHRCCWLFSAILLVALSSTSIAQNHGTLAEWESQVNAFGRNKLRAATDSLEFQQSIRGLDITKELYRNDSAQLRAALLEKICSYANMKASGKWQSDYAAEFYGFIFCDLIGIDWGRLLTVCKTNEANIEIVIAHLFGGLELRNGELPIPFHVQANRK